MWELGTVFWDAPRQRPAYSDSQNTRPPATFLRSEFLFTFGAVQTLRISLRGLLVATSLIAREGAADGIPRKEIDVICTAPIINMNPERIFVPGGLVL